MVAKLISGIVLTLQYFSFGLRVPIIVLFGRPGSGKSTISDRVLSKVDTCIGVDLDICVSQEMRDNFMIGIYPSHSQRQHFMHSACDHVEKVLKDETCQSCLISFSFVNDDLRDVFRTRFPKSAWILVNTSTDTAMLRMSLRSGHFYKGAPQITQDRTINEEWEFASVNFNHLVLNGLDDIELNAERLVKVIKAMELDG